MKNKTLIKKSFKVNNGQFKVQAWFSDPSLELCVMDYDGEGLDNWDYYLRRKDEIERGINALSHHTTEGMGLLLESGVHVELTKTDI
jgi:hypothetical protein